MLVLNRNSILNVITREHLAFFCDMFSNAISASDKGSENVRLIRLSVPNGQKTCGSKGVSLIGVYIAI